jgi:hypothetical protein
MNTWYYQQADQEVGPFERGVLDKLKHAGVIDDATPVKNTEVPDWRTFGDLVAEEALKIADEPQYYYYLDANRQAVGPFDLPTLGRLKEERVITGETLISAKGDAEWLPAGQLTSGQVVLILQEAGDRWKPGNHHSKEFVKISERIPFCEVVPGRDELAESRQRKQSDVWRGDQHREGAEEVLAVDDILDDAVVEEVRTGLDVAHRGNADLRQPESPWSDEATIILPNKEYLIFSFEDRLAPRHPEEQADLDFDLTVLETVLGGDQAAAAEAPVAGIQLETMAARDICWPSDVTSGTRHWSRNCQSRF